MFYDDPASSDGPLLSESDPAGTENSLKDQMSFPLPEYGHGCPYQMLTGPSCWLSICGSTGIINVSAAGATGKSFNALIPGDARGTFQI